MRTWPDYDTGLCLTHCGEYNIQSKQDTIKLLGPRRPWYKQFIYNSDCRICNGEIPKENNIGS